MPSANNAFLRLRAACLATSSRPFLARGSTLTRCPDCLLGVPACLCAWRLSLPSRVDVILLMHRDEVFKPTNTGRLIADAIPANTWAFEWSRTQPDAELLALLQDPARLPLVMFPVAEGDERPRCRAEAAVADGRRITLIVLDGTWRQASRMFRSSVWLHPFPALMLDVDRPGQYRVRQAARDGLLATAEAVALALDALGEPQLAELLDDSFAVFNEHSQASRSGRPPQQTEAHARLAHRRHVLMSSNL